MYQFCALPRFWTISLLPDYQEVIAKPLVFLRKRVKGLIINVLYFLRGEGAEE